MKVRFDFGPVADDLLFPTLRRFGLKAMVIDGFVEDAKSITRLKMRVLITGSAANKAREKLANRMVMAIEKKANKKPNSKGTP